MGLLEQEIKELRDLQREFSKGKITVQDVHARIAIYSQTEKRAKMILQAYALAAKHNKTTLNRLTRSNLIGASEAIDTGNDPEAVMVKCIERDDALVTRQECLDFSGSNLELCAGCATGEDTRRVLLGQV